LATREDGKKRRDLQLEFDFAGSGIDIRKLYLSRLPCEWSATEQGGMHGVQAGKVGLIPSKVTVLRQIL
jgi:hypothetical protein